MSTQAILDHHLQALGDVEETLKDYANDAVVILPDVTLRGIDQIRAAFNEIYGPLFTGSHEMTVKRTEVHGSVAYMVWQFANEHLDFKLGTDTFLIRDGKIAVQTFAAHVEPK